MLYKILPLLWMAFIAAVVLSPLIVSFLGRPKRVASPKKAKSKKKKKGEPDEDPPTDDIPPEPSLDFGDELSQLESAKG